jgi:carbon-monoxide dehydrogenase medium subunit
LIIETRVTLPQAGSGVALADVRLTQGDRPIVNAAALVYRKGNILQSARLAVGGVTPVPIRLPELETRLAGDYLEEATLERVSLEIESSLNPPSDRRTSAEYRRAMAGITVARALRQAWERAKKE